MSRGATEVDPEEALRRIRIVLVRSQGAANVGAVARAMKNMGLVDLALVGVSRRRIAAAATTAVHAADVLDSATRFRSIPEAVADCNLVIGTSAQGGHYRADPELPEEVAGDVLSVTRSGRVAIVFGPEDSGLTRDDLRSCQRLICIDTALEYSSINLAQAVLLVCYELRRQATAIAQPRAAISAASAEELERLEARMKEALLGIGFLNPQNPDRVMFVLRRMIGRAVLRPFEARVLLGMTRRIQWSATAAAVAKRAGLVGGDEPAAAVDDTTPNR